jgi:hypothetical protein
VKITSHLVHHFYKSHSTFPNWEFPGVSRDIFVFKERVFFLPGDSRVFSRDHFIPGVFQGFPGIPGVSGNPE